MTNKITTLFSNKPIKTEIEGIYIKDIPAKAVEEKFGNLDKLLAEEPEKAITLLFVELICDEVGEVFEDCQTYEDITANLSLSNIRKIVEASAKALMGEEATGN